MNTNTILFGLILFLELIIMISTGKTVL